MTTQLEKIFKERGFVETIKSRSAGDFRSIGSCKFPTSKQSTAGC
jgi:hypothetical protein